MEACYKCPVANCYHPTCNRMMSVMEDVSLDANGNPLYTAVCDTMGEVVGDIRASELVYSKGSSINSDELPIADDIAKSIVAQMPVVVAPLTRAINNQTKAFGLLRNEIRGEGESPHEMSAANKSVVKKALDLRAKLISDGTSERNATTDACREVEAKYGIGKYASFEAFRDAVNTKVKNQAYSHGVPECLV